jgi:hypothetical protein
VLKKSWTDPRLEISRATSWPSRVLAALDSATDPLVSAVGCVLTRLLDHVGVLLVAVGALTQQLIEVQHVIAEAGVYLEPMRDIRLARSSYERAAHRYLAACSGFDKAEPDT